MANQEGGFDCEFVKKPLPEAVQSECPVCLLVLREPYQGTCCGYDFCRVCIERVRADNKPCPCCNERGFDCFEDKRLKRSLNNFKVHCTNKKQGCQWVGELGGLENHLNSNPSQDKQLEGCQFTEVHCLHCTELYQCSNVEVHQNDECIKRPFSCEYCKNHNSTFEDVTTNHWPVCGSYPVQCPNKCSSETIERRNIDSHVTKVCPLTIVDCDFKYVGCEVRLLRKDLPTHLTESLVPHVSLQTNQLMDLEKKNKRFEQQVEKLMEDHNLYIDTSQSMIGKLQQQVEKLTRDLNVYEIGIPLCPVEITMTDFEQHKKQWYSPSFYTHPKGYKLSLCVVAEGHGTGANTHVSVYLYLMKGEYDKQLKWPLRGKFIFELLSQDGDGRHSMALNFDNAPDANRNRVVDRERAKEGWGFPTFIPHAELKPTYLQNDCLKFCIKRAE